MKKGLLLALLLCPGVGLAQTSRRDAAVVQRSETAALDREPHRDAPGVTPIDEPLRDTARALDGRVRLDGFLRTRGDLAHRWDLGYGATPSGMGLWPTAYTEGASATQTSVDMRLRLDAHADVGWGVSLHGRIHALDNLRYGSTPEGDFAGGTITQRSPDRPIELRQLYGQVLLPFGMLSAGRMGALVDWGTGFFVNAGNGLDDDFGDVGDRIVFSTPLAGLLWSAAYEISAAGPGVNSVRADVRPDFDLDPRDDVRTAALSVARWDAPPTRRRRLDAGRNGFNFGLLGAHRWQSFDLPPGSVPTGRAAVRRDLSAWTGDAWVRADIGRFTLEGELAMVAFEIGNASLDPALRLDIALTGFQIGGVTRVEYRGGSRFFARVEFGFASGDDRPGFGARPGSNPSPRPGDLDGLQFDLTRTPRDANVDNFRFHPNYRVDLILWRRVIGTVTDAWYLRPMARYRLGSMLTVEGSVVASFAMQPNSTPSGESPLGVETDLGVVYEQEHGFVARLDYGLLVPLSGFRNVARGVDPTVAHALHLVMAFRY